MITVSNAFKTAIKTEPRFILATLTDGVDPITESDDLQSFKLQATGNICRTVMRQLDATFYGAHNYLDSVVNPKIGVVVASDPIVADNFAGTFDGAKWTRTNSVNVVVEGGKLKLHTLASGGYFTLKSIASADFTGKYAFATLNDAGNQSYASLEVYPVYVENSDDTNAYFWLVTIDSIQAYKKVAGVNTQLFTMAYDPELHKVFRIYEKDGTVYFDVSADGGLWDNKADTAVDFDITALKQSVTVGTWAVEADTTTIIVDNINTPTNYANDIMVEYLDYGAFTVIEQKTSEDATTTTIKAYDKMYQSHIQYDLDDAETYPKTIKQLLEAICTRLSWTLGTATFPNDTFEINTEKYSTLQFRFRDVLEQIAEATGSIMYFGVDGSLYLRQVDGTVLETLTKSEQETLTVKAEYGEINSIVLARAPQEDNIVQQDAGSIVTYGTNEFRIENNWLIDFDRETAITDIYDTLVGIKYHPFECVTGGLAYFEIGDRIAVTNQDDSTSEVLIFDIVIEVGAGLSETISSKLPDKTTTNYRYAGIIGKLIKDTQIIVDKQAGQIALIVAELAETLQVPRQSEPPADPAVNDLWLDTDNNIIYIWDGAEWQPTSIAPSTLDNYYTKDETSAEIEIVADAITSSVTAVQTQANLTQAQLDATDALIGDAETDGTIIKRITTVEQSAEQISQRVSAVGGINLLKNSAGLKGTITEWQELDENGDPLDARNTATIDQTTDTQQNSTANSGLKISNQFIKQTIPTLVDVNYMFYCKFIKDCVTTVTINGVEYEITADSYIDDTWAIFQLPFLATQPQTDIVIENTTIGGYAILADMIIKVGEANEWQQAPNEVYTVTSTFDKDGFSVLSADGKFRAVMAGGNFTLYDVLNGNTVIAYFDTTTGKINKLTAQGETVFRRYENPASSLRVIPVEDGVIEVIND